MQELPVTGFGFDGANCARNLSMLLMNRAGCPVMAAHFVEHRAPDTNAGKGCKAGAAQRIVVSRSLYQAHHPGLNQIVDFRMRRKASYQVVRNPLH